MRKGKKKEAEAIFSRKTKYQWFKNTINLAGRTLAIEFSGFISSFKIFKICEYQALGPKKKSEYKNKKPNTKLTLSRAVETIYKAIDNLNKFWRHNTLILQVVRI